MVERFNAYNRKTNNPEEAKKALYIREYCTFLSVPVGTEEEFGRELKRFIVKARDLVTVSEMHTNIFLFSRANQAKHKAWVNKCMEAVKVAVEKGEVTYPFEITPFDIHLTEEEEIPEKDTDIITFQKFMENMMQPKSLHAERKEIGISKIIYQMNIAREIPQFSEMPFVQRALKILTIRPAEETEEETRLKLYEAMKANTLEYDEYRLAYSEYLKEHPILKEEQTRMFPPMKNEIELKDVKYTFLTSR